MILVNKLTEPGGIKKIVIRQDVVQITLSDKTTKIYVTDRVGRHQGGIPVQVSNNTDL